MTDDWFDVLKGEAVTLLLWDLVGALANKAISKLGRQYDYKQVF